MKTQTKGFSLIELLLVMAVLGVLLAIAGLNFNKFIKTQKLQEATSTLAENLRQAGNQARLESRELRIKSTSSSLSWDYGTDASLFKNQALPHSAVLSPVTTVKFSGRGLPTTAATFTVTLYGNSKNVYLLPTGAVIIR